MISDKQSPMDTFYQSYQLVVVIILSPKQIRDMTKLNIESYNE